MMRRPWRHVCHVQDSDVLTEAMKEFGEHFPGLMRPLIQERDEYMVFMLRLLASRCAGPSPGLLGKGQKAAGQLLPLHACLRSWWSPLPGSRRKVT